MVQRGGKTMNCESAQQGILLNYSGELAADQHMELQDHLKGCLDCRQYESDIAHITSLAQKDLTTAGPSKETIGRIMVAGRRAGTGRPVFFAFPATQWLAAAAGFLVLVAGTALLVMAHDRRDAAAHGLRMSQMSTIMTIVSGEEIPASDAALLENAKPDARALARQILQVEGLTGDELADDEDATPDDDAQPRDLQSRSTFDSRPEECV